MMQQIQHLVPGGKIPPTPGAPPTTDTDLFNPCVGNQMTSPFGPRWGGMHEGIDLAGDNTTIVAAADGVVIDVERGCVVGDTNCGGGYGNLVFIKHNINGSPLQSDYCHLSSVAPGIEIGVQVKRGQPIGVMGDTGHSLGAHLHFQISTSGRDFFDPLPKISPQPT